jgi:hypothetical protein
LCSGLASIPVAAVLGSLTIWQVYVVGFLVGRLGIGRTLVVSGAVSASAGILVPLAPRAFPIPFLVASQLARRARDRALQRDRDQPDPDADAHRLLGRMNASRRFVVWGVIPFGNLSGGVLAATIGLRPTLFVGSIACACSVVFLARSPLRSIERLPEAEPAAATPEELAAPVTVLPDA